MKMIKHSNRSKFLTLLLAGCLLSSPFQASCESESLAQQTAKGFTSVAKKAIPAVVSIKVKYLQDSSSYRRLNPFEESPDLFGDDFFYKFFFNPRNERTPKQQTVTGQASGFIVSPDGYILTNSHVVKDASEILVTLNDGREFPAKTIGFDPNTDVAVIKIDSNNLPYLNLLENSDNLEIGEWVVAIGNPLGLHASLTVGVVSAKGRNNLDLVNIEDFIQTDAAINRGNSGGPLLDLDGKVIGMNTAIASMGTGGYMGVGFSIPSNILKHVMDQIISNGNVTRGFLGVTLQSIDQDLAQAFDLKQIEGALVTEVAKNSPAEKSGLKQGDIILGYNKQVVTSNAALKNAISLMSPGSSITLNVLREGKTLQIPVVIGSFPETEPKSVSMSGNDLGFEVQNLSPELKRSLNLRDEEGVVISKMDSNSPAAFTGLKKGALIMAVNQKKISSVEEFNAALKSTPANRPILLLVRQDDAIRFLSLRLK